MAFLSRGKRMLTSSICCDMPKKSRSRGLSPLEEAEWWIRVGLDKNGLEIKFISKEIGCGVFTTATFQKGEFVAEYVGERISRKEGESRNRSTYKNDRHSYLYYFRHQEKEMCIDASRVFGRIGRAVNDSESPNCRMKLIQLKGSLSSLPYLALFTTKNILPGEEIVYDYGEVNLPWRKKAVMDIESDYDSDPFDLREPCDDPGELDFVEQPDNMPHGVDLEIVEDSCDSYLKDDRVVDNVFPILSKTKAVATETQGDLKKFAEDLGKQDYDSDPFDRREPCEDPGELDFVEQPDNMPHGVDLEIVKDSCDSYFKDDRVVDNVFPILSKTKAVATETQGDLKKFAEDLGKQDYDSDPFDRREPCEDPGELDFVEQPDNMPHGVDLEIVKDSCDSYFKDDRVVDNVFPIQSKTKAVVTGTQGDLKKFAEDLGKQDFQCLICDKHFKRRGGLTTHMKMHFRDNTKYKKPKRVCPFCSVEQCDLRRHLILRHSDIPQVAEAASLPKNSEERILAFSTLRKQGIFNYNISQAKLEEPKYMAERTGHTDLVACSKCKGFYSRHLFHRHKERCIRDSSEIPQQFHIDTLSEKSDQFTNDILSKFQSDEVGKVCQKDATIQLIGRRLFQKNLKKVDKTMEVRKSVMCDMRLLARLYLAFKEVSTEKTTDSEDMFIRTNFEYLEQAVDKVTKDDDGKLKYGTKHLLYYLLKSSVQFIVGSHLGRGNDIKAEEIEKFLKLLELHRDVIFGDATYRINLSRQESLRMPEQQADEKQIQLLHQHIAKTIEFNASEYTFVGLHEFVLLRDSLCARITLFNARRGGEPSRLKISRLKDAFTGRWVDDRAVSKLEDWEKDLFNEMLVAYQPGKGNHLVPLLIPADLIQPLKILIDPEIRAKATVHPDNVYVFALTEKSMNHVHGWASIDKMCQDAKCERPELLTASKQRHRVSTLYSAIEVPETERDYFYKHMGHSKAVNMGTYQYPLPVMEVTKVGRHLKNFDKEALNVKSTVHVPVVVEELCSNKSSTCGSLKEDKLTTSDDTCSSASDSDDEVPVSKERSYFRWSEDTTKKVRADFIEWLQLSRGNSLPSKKYLLEYMDNHQLGCTYKQLRTKIMNEQNKQQAIFKKRCAKLNIKET